MTKVNDGFAWEQTFESSVQALSLKGYDLEGLTRAKVEIPLTGLLAHEIMSFDESKFAFVGAENPESKNSSRRTSPSISKPVGDSNPFWQKPDLLILDRDICDWMHPTLYAEFKFFYNWDVNSQGEFIRLKNLDSVQADVDKLTKFKLRSPNTVCIQGIFFCRNDKQEKYVREKEGAVDEQKQISHKGFVRYYEALLQGERPGWRIVSDKVVCLSRTTESENREFWLDLVLLEISKPEL